MSASNCPASVKIVNKSDWDFHHLYLSPADEKEWGPDQLGKESIDRGETFTLADIDCDTYDIRLIDEDGDECVVEDVDLCKDEAVWRISSDALLKCQGYAR